MPCIVETFSSLFYFIQTDTEINSLFSIPRRKKKGIYTNGVRPWVRQSHNVVIATPPSVLIGMD